MNDYPGYAIARPTEYRGIKFRSKSEAVFARALDLGGWVWKYEPEDMELDIGMDAKRARRLETAPTSVRGILERAWKGKSRKTCIMAMCLECVGFDRELIRECRAWACPLWGVRPYAKKVKRNEAFQ